MQSKTLLTVCVAVIAILAIVSGNLWYELRSARQQFVDLQGQLAPAKVPVAQSVQVQAPPVEAPPVQTPPPTIEAPPVRPVAVQLPESRPLPTTAERLERAIAPLPLPLPERPLAQPTLTRPLAGNNDEERRVDAFAQSDRAATLRVAQWSTVLNLTPEQRKGLDATAIAELRRETEDSLQIASRIGKVDPLGAARIKVETVNRQYETLTRIVDKMTPQLTQEQSTTMRTMFANWLTTNLDRARAEEQAALSGR